MLELLDHLERSSNSTYAIACYPSSIHPAVSPSVNRLALHSSETVEYIDLKLCLGIGVTCRSKKAKICLIKNPR